ncbi:MAG: photosynthetic complex assembly protein PuhC [Roseovarius sp.]|nr:photosynthetic complex assembly protein PuhC [Roseovarius sp.]
MADTADHSKPRIYDAELIPRAMTRAMLALVFTVLALVSYARFTDRPLVSTPSQAEVVLTRHIFLSSEMSGAATVLDADGSLLASLSPEEGGFVAGIDRVILRERTKHGVALSGPVTLVQRADNTTSITDPSTGWTADLMGFGQTNALAFTRLLAKK